MPTLREKINKALSNGASKSDISARNKELGLEEADMDLDIDVAKKRGAIRLENAAENVSLKKSADDLYSSIAGTPLPMVPTGPTSAAVPSEEVTPVVGAKRKPYREKVVVPLAQEFVGGIVPDPWQSSLPEFMQPESKENAANTTLEIGPSIEKFAFAAKGIGDEFLEAAADAGYAVADFSAKVGSVITGQPVPPRPKSKPSVTKQVMESVEYDLAIAEDEQADKNPLIRLAEFPVTVVKSAIDVGLGLAELVNYFGGVNVREGETRSESAEKKGAEVLGGLTGMTAETVLNLINPTLWETKPVEAFVTLMPFYHALVPRIKSIPQVGKFVDTASVGLDNAGKALKSVVPKPIKKAAQKVQQVQQTTGDAYKTGDAAESAFVESMMKESEASSALVKETGTRAAGQADAAKIVDTQRVADKPLDAAIDSGPEQILMVETLPEIGPIPVKRKHLVETSVRSVEGSPDTYFADITSEGLSVISDLIKEAEKLDATTNTAKAGLPKVFNNIISRLVTPVTEAFLRMEALDYDSPIAAIKVILEESLDKVIPKDFPNYSKADVVAAYLTIIEDNAKSIKLKERMGAKLTDRVVPPSKTTDIYSVTEGGKLVRGVETSKEVLKTFLEREFLEGLKESIQEQNPGKTKIKKDKSSVMPIAQRTSMEQVGTTVVEIPNTNRVGIPFKTSNPVFDATIAEVAKIVDQAYPDGQTPATRISPERIKARFVAALNETVGSNLQLLRNPKIKKAVLKRLNSILKNATNADGKPTYSWRTRQRIVRDFNYDVLRPAVTENNIGKIRSFELKNNKGEPILTAEELLYVVSEEIAKENPKLIAQAKKQAVLDLADEIASDVQDTMMKKAISDETLRFMPKDGKGKGNPELFLVDYLKRVFNNNEGKGLMLPFEGRKLAAIINGQIETYVKILRDDTMAKNPMADLRVAEADARLFLEGEAARLERMVKIETELLKTGKAEQLVAVEADVTPHPNTYASPELASAINWEMAVRKAMSDPSLGLQIFSMAKRGLTARSLSALKNNNVSNYVALALKTGNPLVFLGVMKKGFYDFLVRKDKSTLSPLDQRAYAAIERSGIIDTTDIAKDIGRAQKPQLSKLLGLLLDEESLRSAQSGYIYKGIQAGLDLWGTAMKGFEDLYTKAGDIPFKVYQAYQTYVRFDKGIREIKVGNYVEGDIGNNVSVRITKKDNGILFVELLDKKGVPVIGKEPVTGTLESPQISQLLGRIGAYEGNKLFFDYGDVGTWNKILKSYPVLNAFSGFYTWVYKSLDIPFIKRGLVSNTFLLSDVIRTNDPVLIKKNINIAAGQATRRALIVNGALGNVQQFYWPDEGFGFDLDEKKQAEIDEKKYSERAKTKAVAEGAKSSLSWAPKDSAGILLGPLGDPANLYYNDFSHQIPFSSTDILMKAGASVLVGVYGMTGKEMERRVFPLYKNIKERNEDKEAVDQERKSLGLFMKDLRGESFAASDIMSLVGLGGSSIFKTFQTIGDTEEQGKIFDYAKVSDDFLNTFIGRTPWTVLKNIIGISPNKEDKKFGFRNGKITSEAQQLSMYYLSQVIGAGWKKVNLLSGGENIITGKGQKSRFEWYLEGVKKELNIKLVRPLEDRAKLAKSASIKETDPVLKQRHEEDFQFYRQNSESVKEQIKELLDRQRMLTFQFFQEKKAQGSKK